MFSILRSKVGVFWLFQSKQAQHLKPSRISLNAWIWQTDQNSLQLPVLLSTVKFRSSIPNNNYVAFSQRKWFKMFSSVECDDAKPIQPCLKKIFRINNWNHGCFCVKKRKYVGIQIIKPNYHQKPAMCNEQLHLLSSYSPTVLETSSIST